MPNKFNNRNAPNCKCEFCGIEFYLSPSHKKRGWGIFCSKKCQFQRPWDESKFWNRFIEKNGCLVWIGPDDGHGYGVCWGPNKRLYKTHRLAWILRHGLIPEGLDVLHKCDNPPCALDEHLFVGTHLDNMKDMINKGRAAVGEKSCLAKLTSDQVINIKRSSHSGESVITLAKQFKVQQRTIRRIIDGVTWAHIRL